MALGGLGWSETGATGYNDSGLCRALYERPSFCIGPIPTKDCSNPDPDPLDPPDAPDRPDPH